MWTNEKGVNGKSERVIGKKMWPIRINVSVNEYYREY